MQKEMIDPIELVKELETKNAALRKENAELLSTNADLSQKVNAQDEEMKELNTRYSACLEKVEYLNDRVEGLEKYSCDRAKECDGLKKGLATLYRQKNELHRENEILKIDKLGLEDEKEGIQKRYDLCRDKLAENEKEIFILTKALGTIARRN